ncbi:cyclic nucleotide-binding domain-containing protein [Conexibacter sp. W3-3-2]|uniref:Cyclic nucleotide-binding domain-containing protein n=1 Tax=Paraconexibacter algicola TaxID=2133960 RepID=A0A2T4UME5_9ACTN|nr:MULTISPECIES: cyclic nucleotide-binding domain-containing protein [Solirubrobacterales]MTD46677.1 cyclic nucleotide-binding domain-containing protein [Conexibacter sp. W3-3-2]PTL60398.1 hypothetical protein C7Y72_12480 [Paraconexibacter algicola]
MSGLVQERMASLRDDVPSFADMGDEEAAVVAALVRPFSAPAGQLLLRQGAAAGDLHVLRSGRVEISYRSAGGARVAVGEVGPGGVLGETSLIGRRRRFADAIALEDVEGWVLHGGAFEQLRTDVRPGAVAFTRRIGDVAVRRLRERYAALQLAAGGPSYPEPQDVALPSPTAPESAEYLRGLLCFRSFADPGMVADLCDGLRRTELARGTTLIPHDHVPAHLLLVVRGAVEVSVRGGEGAQRVRLAGPGRFVGHNGVLDDGPSPVMCRARERVVLLGLPRELVRAALDSPEPRDRALTRAVHEDVVRAQAQAERPMARTAVRS